MNTQRKLIAALSVCAAATFPCIASAIAVNGQGTWETTLQGRDLDGDLTTAEAFYDTALNISWLSDANAGAGSAYDNGYYPSDGGMTWANANDWAASLDFNGISGWRLPTTDGSTSQSGEMGHMFYITLGDTAYNAGNPSQPYGLTNTGPFNNLRSGGYWTDTRSFGSSLNNDAFCFDFNSGFQCALEWNGNLYAWAVHDGDVGVALPTSTIPIPAAAWLFSSGLLGLIGITRRK